MTYEDILNRMLERVPNDVDKREGSIIYDALSPAAAELSQMYVEIENNADLCMLDTTIGTYLDRKALDFGIERKQSTYAIRKAIMVASEGKIIDIPIDTRFEKDMVFYSVISKISDTEYRLVCEVVGAIGNLPFGKLNPIDSIQYLDSATLTDIIIPGEETESDELLRLRVKNKISNSSQDGNVAQYLQWASEYSGVGKAKVFPLWNGGNTVKLSITSSENTPASSQLISDFQKYLDPNSEGLGEGKAPLGAKVTVATGTSKQIDIRAEIVLEEGYSNASEASAKIVEYLRNITYRQSYVSYFFIGNILVGLDSIYDMRNLRLNGTSADIAVGEEEIPTLGSLNLTVVT